MIFADREGVIRFWNAGAERIFGFSEAEVIGKSLDIIISESLRGRHWSGFRQAATSGETRYSGSHTLAVRALRKGGGTISVKCPKL